MSKETDIRDSIERAIWNTAGVGDPQRQLDKKLRHNASRGAFAASTLAHESRPKAITMDDIRAAARTLENPPAYPRRVKVKSLTAFEEYLHDHKLVKMVRLGPNCFDWLGCAVTEHDHLAEGCAHIIMSDDTVKIAHFHEETTNG